MQDRRLVFFYLYSQLKSKLETFLRLTASHFHCFIGLIPKRYLTHNTYASTAYCTTRSSQIRGPPVERFLKAEGNCSLTSNIISCIQSKTTETSLLRIYREVENDPSGYSKQYKRLLVLFSGRLL